MKTIGFILSVLIVILLELPAIVIYFRPTSNALDIWMILSITIVSAFAQNTGRDFYNWFINKYW